MSPNEMILLCNSMDERNAVSVWLIKSLKIHLY